MSELNISHLIIGNQVQAFTPRWYFIPNSRDAYCVGSDGKIWSRFVRAGKTWVIGGPDDWKERVLTPDKNGYLHCCLSLITGKVVVRTHLLVANFFIGPCPVGLQCCHDDGNPQNNHVCNLRYDTQINNQHDRFKHGTHNRGERGSKAVLTWEKVDLIREEYCTGKRTMAELAEEHGVTPKNIGFIVRNQTWVR